MSSHKNRVKMTVSGTPGTGTITLSAASTNYQSFATAYGANATVDVLITEGTSWEVARDCTYTHSGTTLSRGTLEESSTGSAVSFTSAAVVSEILTAAKGQMYETALASLIPGGRLTLESGVPVSTADQSAKTSVFYTPFRHEIVPLWNGFEWEPNTFAELTNVLADSATGNAGPAAVVAETCYDLFVWDNAGTVTLTRGPAWAQQATVTMTIATPCVVTWTGSPLRGAAPIVFTTSGALPTGITAGTTYYVSRGVSGSASENSAWGNTFNISTTAANAAAGTLVATSGTQPGTHTATTSTRGRGTGSGTTELEYFQGRYVNKYDITNGPTARKGLFVGTFCTNSSAQVEDKSSGGSASISGRLVGNQYNTVGRALSYIAGSSSHAYTSAVPREYNNSTAPRVHWITPLLGEQKTVFGCNADFQGAGARLFATVNAMTYGAAQVSAGSTTGISSSCVDVVGGNAYELPNKTAGANWVTLLQAGSASGNYNFGIIAGVVDI